MNTPAKSSARRSGPTKPELEAMVSKLKAALEESKKKEESLANLRDDLHEAHTKEGYLQQQIIDLQSDLELERKLVQKLQKELEKLGDIKTELDKAKRAASRLAEANEKLTQEIKALTEDNKDFKVHKNEAHKIEAHKIDAHEHEAYESSLVGHNPGRPIQKESDKPADFAAKSWLL
jgi:chromosome segregation ATPase